MKVIEFLAKLIGYFFLGCIIIIGCLSLFGYVKFKSAMNVVEEIEVTYSKECGDAKNITIKNNKVYCDGKLIKRLEE